MTTTPPTDNDRRHMRAALTLARRGLGNVWPNPAVGCVLVREDLNDRIVGRGWTQPGGRPHAETEALRLAGDLAAGATAYVTLEPCNHTGETGPCTEALIAAGVARVIVAAVDPDRRVAGTGLTRLSDAGIATQQGLFEAEARTLNQGYFNRVGLQRPFITMKLATTLDGRIASRTGHSQWITGPLARQRGHLLRASHDAILTGIGTVLADDPSLTCRLDGLSEQSPVRVVLDSQCRMPGDSTMVKTAHEVAVWRYCTTLADQGFSSQGIVEKAVGADKTGRVDIAVVLGDLAEHGITRLLVEAGPAVSASFLGSGLVDAIAWFRAPSVMGSDGRAVAESIGVDDLADMAAFHLQKTYALADDTLEIYTRPDDA